MQAIIERFVIKRIYLIILNDSLLKKWLKLDSNVDEKSIWEPISGWGRVVVYHFKYFEGILGFFPVKKLQKSLIYTMY